MISGALMDLHGRAQIVTVFLADVFADLALV
jgi:hypothetical protein